MCENDNENVSKLNKRKLNGWNTCTSTSKLVTVVASDNIIQDIAEFYPQCTSESQVYKNHWQLLYLRSRT